MWNKNICLTNRICVLIISGALFSTLVLAGVYNSEEPILVVKEKPKVEIWIPTAEDIAYQDSMYIIIKSTQNDIIDIKEDIIHILERLDYADGTWDSIRYVKGGAIDKRRNQ
tara:strand:+ start:23 stop:358 length:336 start_codon:yes stop_codon:yes gene_type:complete